MEPHLECRPQSHIPAPGPTIAGIFRRPYELSEISEHRNFLYPFPGPEGEPRASRFFLEGVVISYFTRFLSKIGFAISSKSKRINLPAHQIHSGITTIFGIKSTGVKNVNFQVLRETIALCPSILIELCFLSNWNEAKYLSENYNLKALAFSIMNSLIKL